MITKSHFITQFSYAYSAHGSIEKVKVLPFKSLSRHVFATSVECRIPWSVIRWSKDDLGC